MITRKECADFLNVAIEQELTTDERNTLVESVRKTGPYLAEALIEIVGDVSYLVEVRDGQMVDGVFKG